jgi:hypothetical protein
VFGFPNIVPSKDDWENCLPRFKGNDGEVLVEHLLEFHECLHQLGIVHEYVLLNMCRYTLEGKTHEWCQYFPPSNISSLNKFHVAFHYYCKDIFPTESLFESFCEKFELLYHHYNHEVRDKYVNKMHVETFVHIEGYIEHVVNVIGIDEINLLPSDLHNNLVSLESAQEVSVLETYQQKLSFLHKLEICYDFQYLVAIYMETIFS